MPLNAKSTTDYRFNYKEPGKIISVEVKCCGQHIGEMRFQDGEEKTCPTCGMKYSLRMDCLLYTSINFAIFHIRHSCFDLYLYLVL